MLKLQRIIIATAIAASLLVGAHSVSGQEAHCTATHCSFNVTLKEPTVTTPALSKSQILWKASVAGAAWSAITTVDIPASAPAGGGTHTRKIVVPAPQSKTSYVHFLIRAVNVQGVVSPSLEFIHVQQRPPLAPPANTNIVVVPAPAP
jgi:hypothetical protein